MIILILSMLIYFVNADCNIGYIHDGSGCVQDLWVDSIFSTLSEEERIAQLFMVAAYSNKDDKHNSLIDITEKINVKLNYPKIQDTEKLDSLENVDSIFKLITSCIDYIMDGEEMHKVSDYTENEVETFLNSLSSSKVG